jgi:capsular exopolysaccharide synthesis family protein
MQDTAKIRRQKTGEDDQIDFKKILNKLSGHWLWFTLSVIIALSVAILYLQYKQDMYVVNARVLINDPQSSSSLGKQGSALMDLGGLMGGSSSVDNEAEILKTPDLVAEVVQELKLNIVYSQRSNFLVRELYRAPFLLSIDKSQDTIKSVSLDLTILPGNRVRVSSKTFNRDLAWNESFNLPEVGLLRLVPVPGMLLKKDLVYNVEVASVDVTVIDLMNRMSVGVSNKQVTIIDLSLNHPVQKKGEEILSAIIEKYKATNLEDKNATADSTYMFIKKRLNVIASELGDVENKVERFKTQNSLADMSEQGKLLVQSTGQYTADLAKAETQLSVLEELEDYLKDEKKNKRVYPTALLPSDLVFSNLMSQYNSLLAERDRALMSVTEATPFVQNLNKQIDEMRGGILANVQSSKSSFTITRDKLRAQVTKAQGQIQGVPQIEKDYLQLARNQQIKQELYIFLMQKAEETAISKMSNISIAKVIAKPKAGLYPVSPSKKAAISLAIFLGLVVPLAVIVIRGLLDTSISTKEDIVGATDVPVIGEISHNLTKENLVVLQDSRTAIAEQFRALRSNLSFYLKNKEQNVILLTSSMSGEGKSFVAINLASALALLGKKVLLMEIDLRKPGLSTKLNLRNDVGFSNYIIDEKLTASDVIKPLVNINPNLSIITSGPLPPNPIEILMNERTARLMETVKQQFDYVIMDAPPIGIVADAESVAVFADMTLYLVRQKRTQIAQLAIVDDLYQTQKINNLAIIVNDVTSKQNTYGNYGNDLTSPNWFARLLKRK